MRVAVWHNLPSGGGKRALFEHLRGLVSRGHYVEIWSPSTANRDYLPLSEFGREHVKPFEPRPARTASPLAWLSPEAHSTLEWLRTMDAHCRWCAREIEDSSFDVLFVASSMKSAVTSIAQHTTIPAVLYLQEPTRELYEAIPELPWALPPRNDRFGRVAARYIRDAARITALRSQVRREISGISAFRLVLVNSFFSRESVLRAYGSQAEVCYLGVDTERFVDKGLPRQEFVMGVGSFSRSKRIDVVIDAVASMSFPRPPLAWVGNAVDQAYLAQLVMAAERKEVQFIPRIQITEDELVALLNEAAAMIYAPRLEPFGYAPLEASACGLPVISIREGGIRETVLDGETGVLVDSDTDLGPALANLLADPARGRDLGRRGRQHVLEKWSIDVAIDRLESCLVMIAGGS